MMTGTMTLFFNSLGRTLLASLWLWQTPSPTAAAPQPTPQGGENLLARIWSYINHKFTIGNFEISLASFVIGLLLFVVAIIISRSIRAFMERRMVARARLDPGIQYTVLRLIHYVVITLGILFALLALSTLKIR